MLRSARHLLPWAPGAGRKRRKRTPAELLETLGRKRGPSKARDGAVVDIEVCPTPKVARALRRRKVPAPAHSMSNEGETESLTGQHGDDTKNKEDQQMDLLNFYDVEVKKVKDTMGDKDHAPIQGNLYRYMALRGFGEASGLIQSKADPVLLAGLYLVVFTQIFAPIFILMWVFFSMTCSGGYCLGVGEWRFDSLDSDNYGISHILQRFLGLIFIIIYCMNGAYNMHSEQENMEKTMDMADVFEEVAERSEEYVSRGEDDEHNEYLHIHKVWLWLDPIVNIWCFVLTAIALVPLFSIAEDGPKDIVYDAFALLFLFNLDDIGGDLAFLDEKWDEDQFGHIFGALADASAADDWSEGALLEDIREYREHNLTPDNLYFAGRWLCWGLLIVLPVIYAFSEIRPAEDQASTEDVAVVREGLARLQAQVDQLVAAGAAGTRNLTGR